MTRILIGVGCIFVDDKYIPFLDRILLIIDNVGGVTAQHKNKLREVRMVVEKHVLVMMTILDIERKILLCGKVLKIHF